MESIEDFLKTLNNVIDNNMFVKVLKDLKIEIKDNKNSIKKVNEIDFKYTNKNIDIDTLIEIIEKFEENNNNNSNFNEENNNTSKDIFYNVFVTYSGDPYMTLNLCLLALKNKKKLSLNINDNMLGVNKFLVSLFNKVLENYKISSIVRIYNLISNSEIKKIQDSFENIIIIDDFNTYTLLKNCGVKKVKFFAFYSIDMYTDTEDLEELQLKIFEYANKNGTDIEIYRDYDIDEVIEIINEYGTGNIALLLTKSKENENKFRNGIKNKKILVNENPFKNKFNLLPINFFE